MQKVTLKKLISVLLVLALAVTLVTPSFAAADAENTVLVVTGFSEYPLVDWSTW